MLRALRGYEYFGCGETPLSGAKLDSDLSSKQFPMNYYQNVYIGIGSNLDNAKENCQQGIIELGEIKKIKSIQCSFFYKTEPVGGPKQDWYINCITEIETSLSPEDLLICLQKLEKKMGRVKSIKWGPRNIDFDILFFDNKIINTRHLKIPHPLNQERRFVMEPMEEIAPDMIHPVLKKNMKELKKNATCLNQKIELYQE